MPKPQDELIPTRVSLINRLKDWEDQATWQEFFDTYWKLIYGVARKSGLSDAEAQDVVQDTMASVAKHMPGFQYDPAIGSFKGWLLNMTRWRIIDLARKRTPQAGHRPLSAGDDARTDTIERIVDPASQDLDKLWDVEWERSVLDAALTRLKRRIEPLKYQIFDFYVNKEWPPEKVAARFQVPVDAVYTAKHRITAMLKEEVERLARQMT